LVTFSGRTIWNKWQAQHVFSCHPTNSAKALNKTDSTALTPVREDHPLGSSCLHSSPDSEGRRRCIVYAMPKLLLSKLLDHRNPVLCLCSVSRQVRRVSNWIPDSHWSWFYVLFCASFNCLKFFPFYRSGCLSFLKLLSSHLTFCGNNGNSPWASLNLFFVSYHVSSFRCSFSDYCLIVFHSVFKQTYLEGVTFL